jgi:deoxyuridine 5'-triphosphate nucleotidohydrolase
MKIISDSPPAIGVVRLPHAEGLALPSYAIDSDYRGEVKVLLVNLGDDSFVVSRGARIAQIVFAAVVRVTVVERNLAGGTARGSGGFGSTGAA